MQSYCRHSLHALVFLLALLFVAAPAHALTVNDVRIGLHPDKTRMVVELSEMSKFRVFVLDNPWRLVIDLPSFDWQAGQISKPVKSPVKTIRQGALQPGVSRIAIDLKEPVSVDNAFLLRKNEGKPNRLVIDFTKTTADGYAREKGKVIGILEVDGKTADKIAETPKQTPPPKPQRVASATTAAPIAIPPPPPAQKQQATPPPVSVQQTAASGMALPQRKPYIQQQMQAPPPAAPLKKPLIVVDPGHGGVDPGAIGANGVFEKHVALAMAKDLKRMLESTGRYDVVLTRDRDIYKRLYQRVAFARERSADLFISIHADSIGKSNVRGASIYTLSEKASDKQTARLAERENKADIIAGVDISHEDEQVANILIDLAMRDTMNQSKFFANTIVENMKRGGVKILEKPHRSAGFAVLKAPDIPSVLIEIGFMSNKSEAQMLSKPEYRRKIAQTIVYGIDSYFEKVSRNNRI